jgi:hypothetical protein
MRFHLKMAEDMEMINKTSILKTDLTKFKSRIKNENNFDFESYVNLISEITTELNPKSLKRKICNCLKLLVDADLVRFYFVKDKKFGSFYEKSSSLLNKKQIEVWNRLKNIENFDTVLNDQIPINIDFLNSVLKSGKYLLLNQPDQVSNF